MSLSRIFFILFIASVYFAPQSTGAQFDIESFLNTGGSVNALQVRSTPATPGPLETVVLDAELFSFDLNRAEITWSENGVRKATGIGVKRFQFKTGPLGSETVIDVTVTGERTASKSLSFRPGEVDLIWEADTYTPPFYRGKPLASPKSSVTILATPHLLSSPGGRELQSSDIIYEWSVDGTVLGSRGGAGKNSLTMTAPGSGSLSVKVVASSFSGTLKAEKEIVIPVVDPQIVFYEESPVLGTRFDRALNGTFTLSGREARLLASPFYFSAPRREGGNLSYSWKINGTPLSGAEGKSAIVLSGGSEGSSLTLDLTIDHIGNFLQTAAEKLSASVPESNSNAFFGR